MSLARLLLSLVLISQTVPPPVDPPPPRHPGRLVDVGGHLMHFHCTGTGSPAVVVEYGLGDFSTDWSLVEARVRKFTRICTYDRAGYAWSEPGPLPRTYPQLNLELHEGLRKLGERGPFILVGHSFGGPVVRSYAAAYPDEVTGLVLVDTIHEDQRIPIMGKAVRLRASATGRAIPPARMEVLPEEKIVTPSNPPSGPPDPLYRVLAPENQLIHEWASSLSSLESAEDSERQWSPESLALMHGSVARGILGSRPLVVLTRARGGYDDTTDVPGRTLDSERLAGQKLLLQLSGNSSQRVIDCGHNMHLEAPGQVAAAIRSVVLAARDGRRL